MASALRLAAARAAAVSLRQPSLALSATRTMSAAPRKARVSTPHPVTNLRQVQMEVRDDETESERRLRERLESDYQWNHEFWLENNKRFQAERRDFLEQYRAEHPDKCGSNGRVPPEVMAKFYKRFLDQHATRHRRYNREWWTRNLAQVPLFAAAYASRLGRMLGNKPRRSQTGKKQQA